MPTEEQALIALREIERILQQRIGMHGQVVEVPESIAGSHDPRKLCRDYHLIRPKLDIALTQIERIPVYGRNLATAIRFLMQVADAYCDSVH